MSNDLKIYVGYDSREDIAWQVCRHSINRHAGQDLPVHPLKLTTLAELGLYTRDIDAKASTEFSLSRFLTPFLAGKSGWSIFVDCDFLFSVDARSILEGKDKSKAVYVVKHDYVPRNAVKMDGKEQTTYPCKNWSSFILFNNEHPDVQKLTPEYTNSASPADLHRFNWIENRDDIGALDLTWNFLEGEYDKPEQQPNCVHYTNGGPWFENWQDVDYAQEWLDEKAMYEASL